MCVCPAGPLTVLCGGATFHWIVMKFPRIIKLELYPYMSPEVGFSSPPAACQFQFRAQTECFNISSPQHAPLKKCFGALAFTFKSCNMHLTDPQPLHC